MIHLPHKVVQRSHSDRGPRGARLHPPTRYTTTPWRIGQPPRKGRSRTALVRCAATTSYPSHTTGILPTRRAFHRRPALRCGAGTHGEGYGRGHPHQPPTPYPHPPFSQPVFPDLRTPSSPTPIGDPGGRGYRLLPLTHIRHSPNPSCLPSSPRTPMRGRYPWRGVRARLPRIPTQPSNTRALQHPS